METGERVESDFTARDETAMQSLFDTCYGLGDYHKVEGERNPKYLYRQRDECLTSLQDLEKAVSQTDAGCVRAKLGEWQVLQRKIVPLLTSYIEDSELASHLLKLMVLLTMRVGIYGPPPTDRNILQEQEREQLRHMQDYKEAFTNPTIFTMIVRLLVGALDGEASAHLFKDVLFLLRNLVSVPDPGPGDTGYTPLRGRMQMTFIRNFCEEGVLTFFMLLATELVQQQQEDIQQVWALADILYHVCTHFDPDELLTSNKDRSKPKSDLADLLARDKADQKLMAPPSSRHSRFGTSMATMSRDGSMLLSSSVQHNNIMQKSGALLKKEFRNPETSGKKTNMFHSLFFVDLCEGSVREYNQVNPHVRGVLDDRMYHPLKILQGYRTFFENLCSTSFSSLVSIMRSSCKVKPSQQEEGSEFDMPHLLNFICWFLEFHRVQHAIQVKEAEKTSSTPPDMDIAVIQGAIDLDMIQFTTARLRDYGKNAQIHSSFLVIVLRALAAQVQTIKVMTGCEGSDTRDCGDLLVTHTVKDDVLGNLAWIMKNFNSAVHDPRILSYSVEVWHNLTMLMQTRGSRGAEAEFQVERLRGVQMTRSSTSVEKEITGIADSRVVQNLFHLLEKYKRHTPTLQSMLVKLIHSIMQAHPTNIVLFFEVSYFQRIQRIMTDPLLISTKNAEKYKDLLGLLRFILREFFKCADTNKCVFGELLFPKIQESQKDQLETCAVEFGAILTNYEEEAYRRILDRMDAGDTLTAMKKQRADVMKGQGWTEEEDAVLRRCYPAYKQHPLCAEVLVAELPEDNNRTALQVRRRLIELGLMPAKGAGRGAAGEVSKEEPAAKKAKVHGDADMGDTSATGKPATQASSGKDAAAETEQDDEMLEEDLERLLDAAYDSLPTELDPPTAAASAPTATASAAMDKAASAAPTARDEASTAAPTADEASSFADFKASAAPAAPTAMDEASTAAPTAVDEAASVAATVKDQAFAPPTMLDKAETSESAAGTAEGQPTMPIPCQDDMELELERLMEEEMPASAPAAASQGGQADTMNQQSQDDLELDLERLMEDEISPSAKASASQGQGEPVQPSRDDLELDLERLMEEEISPSATGNSREGGGGQSDTVKPSRDDLELELERLMEEASAASRAGA